jgi:hypothetical protein
MNQKIRKFKSRLIYCLTGASGVMQVFPSLQVSESHITQFFTKRIQSSGFLRSKALETVKILPFNWRPFRRIRWECVTDRGVVTKPCFSYVDERCLNVITEPVERLLLWRPTYIHLQPEPLHPEGTETWSDTKDIATLEPFISQVVEDWKTAQTMVTSLTPKIRETQSSIFTGFGAFVPRTPARRHRERELVDDRKNHQAMLRGLSMVLNCPEYHFIERGIVEDRVGVGTLAAEYTHLDGQSTRYIALETAGAHNFTEAHKNGRALTRLLALNAQSRTAL